MKSISDKPNELVPTRLFPHAKFPFEYFNPIQSALFDVYDRDANVLVAASTSSGKTACAEMYLSHEVRVRGGKGMYVGPYKSLIQEKIDDWTDPKHHFADLNLSICTGDYVLTESRKKELAKANLILMTAEMLSSRVRNIKSENNTWLKKVNTLTIDETHLLVDPGRGDHLEVAMMKITDLNPDVRLVMLSATLPNVKEVCDWATVLTGKKTYLLESSYRPCPLNVHYEEYYDGSRDYDETELEKVFAAMQIVNDYPEDKFLIFAHTKRTMELMKIALKKDGIESDFHNADLPKEKRVAIEHRFRTDPTFRVLIATSTLSAGVNLPARRVIVLGIHRGMSFVENLHIHQECGRAGRPAYDPAGDAYVLLPAKKFKEHVARLQEPTLIRSQLLSDDEGNARVLAFHLVSEIHHRGVKNREDIHRWYARSLAHHQNRSLGNAEVDRVLERLVTCGAVKEEEGELSVTSVGAIASMFYYNPVDVANLKRNFTKLFESSHEDDDVRVAFALGNTESHCLGIVSKAEREEMGSFSCKVGKIYGTVPDPAVKAAFCYYNLLNGNASGVFNGMMRGLQADFPRVNQVIQVVDSMAAKWGRKDYLNRLKLRVQYGVKGNVAYLCEIKDVGGVRAQKLYDAGIRTVADVASNPGVVKNVLNMKQERIDEIVAHARLLKMQKAMGG